MPDCVAVKIKQHTRRRGFGDISKQREGRKMVKKGMMATTAPSLPVIRVLLADCCRRIHTSEHSQEFTVGGDG